MLSWEEIRRRAECEKVWHSQVDVEVLDCVKAGASTATQVQNKFTIRTRQEIIQSLARLLRNGTLTQESKPYGRESEGPNSLTR